MHPIYQRLDDCHHKKVLISRTEIGHINPAIRQLLVRIALCLLNGFNHFLFHMLDTRKNHAINDFDLLRRKIFSIIMLSSKYKVLN